MCAVQPEWFPKLLPNLCSFSKPMDDPPVRYDIDSGKIKCHMSCTFGMLMQEFLTIPLR